MSKDVHLGRTGADLGARNADASAAIESNSPSVMMQAVSASCCVVSRISLVFVDMMAPFSGRTLPVVN